MRLSELTWEHANRYTEISQTLAGEDGEPFRLSRKLLPTKPTGTPVYEYGMYTTGPVQTLKPLMFACILKDAKPYKRNTARDNWMYDR
jgi:hypothetical protein